MGHKPEKRDFKKIIMAQRKKLIKAKETLDKKMSFLEDDVVKLSEKERTALLKAIDKYNSVLAELQASLMSMS